MASGEVCASPLPPHSSSKENAKITSDVIYGVGVAVMWFEKKYVDEQKESLTKR